jgi:hypothetical protein
MWTASSLQGVHSDLISSLASICPAFCCVRTWARVIRTDLESGVLVTLDIAGLPTAESQTNLVT